MDKSAPDSDFAHDRGPAIDTSTSFATSNEASPVYHALPPKPVLDSSAERPVEAPTSTYEAQEGVTTTHNPDHGSPVGICTTSLPVEVLQHIFSFVDPISLGRLLSVCRLFTVLLDPSKPLPSSSMPMPSKLSLQPQDEIWSKSRRNFARDYPRPMEGMTELEMWKLVHGSSCQFCGKKPKAKVPLLATRPWNAGPGPEGVRAIWPFRCRSCGPCLETKIVKETELLVSRQSILLHGLPSAFMTPSFNYVTSVTLRTAQPPTGLQLTKYFFQPQIDDLSKKEIDVRGFGPATIQEWYKGLEALGIAHMKDAARFEQWHHGAQPSLQLDPVATGHLSGSTSPALSMASSAMYSHHFAFQSPHRPFSAQSTPIHPGHPAAQQYTPAGSVHSMPLQTYASAPGHIPQPDHFNTSPFPSQHIGAGPALLPPPLRPRQERNLQEIDRLKAERRADIQRRCLDLDPPIQPSALSLMSAFNAALQIARPLTDQEWDNLKERLLTQRQMAETAERGHQNAASSALLKDEERQKLEQKRREAQDNADKTWSEIQKPSGEKAREYANEFIQANWAEGRAVNKLSSGRFAAETLMHVRRRYFESIVNEDALLSSKSMTIPHDSPIHEVRRLKLEDMKHVYEETIRPHIERFGREVFLCHTCEASAKRFTFDAVIQHYAAKHTSSLSRGTKVVYWPSNWPEEPPFHPNPDSVWNRPTEHRQTGLPFGATSPAYTPNWTPYPGASWMSPLAPGQPNGIYHVQCDELLASAKRVWDATEQIRYLPDSVRLYVVIQQVARSFSRKFTNEPTLSMFTDCVDHKPLLKSLKDVGGLICKACKDHGDAGARSDTFALSDLLQHFQRAHIGYDATSPRTDSSPPFDWKFDMIKLPPSPIIQNIVHAPGINQEKFDIVAEVLPSYFPPPLPRIGSIPFDAQHFEHDQPPFAVSGAGVPEYDGRGIFKRPLEEDSHFHRPSVRRAMEYDPYNPRGLEEGHASWPRNHANVHNTYLSGGPGEGLMYVDRSQEPALLLHEREPFPPRARPMYYSVQDGPHDRPRRRIIREVEDDARYSRSSHSYVVEHKPRDPVLQPVGEEAGIRPSTQDDGMSAAENFLNNFDRIAAETSHAGDSESRSRDFTPSQSRGAHRDAAAPASRHYSPGGVSQGLHRSRRGSPIPLLDEPTDIAGRATFSPSNEAARARNQNAFVPPPIHYRMIDDRPRDRPMPTRRYADEDGSDRGEGAVPYEYDHYAESSTRPLRRNLYESDPSLPERGYHVYEDRWPVKYIETLPNGQRRLVEELPSPTFERLDFVTGPRQYVDRGGGYYVERPIYSPERGFPPPDRNYRRSPHESNSSNTGVGTMAPPGAQLIKYEDDQ